MTKYYIKAIENNNWGEVCLNPEFDNLSVEELKELNWYNFIPIPYDMSDTRYEYVPKFILQEDIVSLIHNKLPKTGDSLDFAIKAEWQNIRNFRNELLKISDYTQVEDTPISNKLEWKEYRKQLRDITYQNDPFEIKWPTAPNGESLNMEIHRV